jgi:hypothetical protein
MKNTSDIQFIRSIYDQMVTHLNQEPTTEREGIKDALFILSFCMALFLKQTDFRMHEDFKSVGNYFAKQVKIIYENVVTVDDEAIPCDEENPTLTIHLVASENKYEH